MSKWSQYRKIDFCILIFRHVTFDGPDGWTKVWILSNPDVSKRRQQGGSSEMRYVGIVDQTIIEPFKVDEGVKLNCCNFMSNTFFAWYTSQFHSFKVKIVFMLDNE